MMYLYLDGSFLSYDAFVCVCVAFKPAAGSISFEVGSILKVAHA